MRGLASASIALACFAIWLTFTLSGNPQESPQRVQFVERGTSAGVNFRYRNSPTPEKYLIETMGGGVAIFDYNNDGWPDIFFVNGAALNHPQSDDEPPDKSAPAYWNRLYRNNHDGTFTDVTLPAGLRGTGYGMGVATGDYNNDGYTDLFVTNYGGGILYRNNGDGTFIDVTAQAGLRTQGWTTGAAFFDYNNDGCLDLFVARYLDWNFAKGSITCGVNVPGGRAYCHPDEFKPVSNYLFKNNCNGTFTDVSQSSHIADYKGKALGVAIGDYNNDGLIDLDVANDSYPQFLFKNNGDGTFSNVAPLAGAGYTEDGNTFAGMGTDFVDLDNDGYPDLLTTALPYQYYAYFHNNGDGTFTYASILSGLSQLTRNYGGWGIRAFDYNNDGNREVFLVNSHVMDNIRVTEPTLRYREPPLLLSYGDGRFTNISSESGEVFKQSWAARGAAFGDLDNDGDIDVVVSDYSAPAHLLINEGGNGNNWIALDLRGTRSNRDAIGAKIALTSGNDKVQYAMVSTAGSYLSASDRRVFFGIGREIRIKAIQIRWPSGTLQTIDNPTPDHFLKVVEPSNRSPGSPSAFDTDRDSLPRIARVALLRFESDSASEPTNAQAMEQYNRGISLVKVGNNTGALAAFQKATRLQPDFTDAYFALGVLLARLGHYRQAMPQFLQVLKLNSKDVDARINLSNLLEQEGDFESSASEMREAVRLAPRNLDLLILLGQKLQRARKYPEAIHCFRRALELNPQSSQAHYGLGLAYRSMARQEEALKQFSATLALNPKDAKAHYELGCLFLQQGQWKEAEDHLRQALQLRPQMAEGYSQLGKLYRREGKLQAAGDAYRQALRINPHLREALYGLATLLKEQGKPEQAARYFQKVKSEEQGIINANQAAARNADGISFMNEGKMGQALQAFQAALAGDPTFALAAYNMGVVFAKMGQNEKAVNAFKTAIRLNPGFAMAHFGLGLVLRTMGDPSAGAELEEARLLGRFVPEHAGQNGQTTAKPPY